MNTMTVCLKIQIAVLLSLIAVVQVQGNLNATELVTLNKTELEEVVDLIKSTSVHCGTFLALFDSLLITGWKLVCEMPVSNITEDKLRNYIGLRNLFHWQRFGKSFHI